jgi:peroxin-11B
MVVDTLAHHPAVAHYLRFVATTVGRDKALRTLQYLARFLSWYLMRKGYPITAITPWEAMKKNFGAARKVMRIGKNAEHLKAASVVRLLHLLHILLFSISSAMLSTTR